LKCWSSQDAARSRARDVSSALGTLIVADLLFNFGRGGSLWTRLFARYVMRLKNFIGMSPFFRLMIRDRQAFRRSMATMMAWDFDRVIVAHGGIIERGGKARLREVLTRPVWNRNDFAGAEMRLNKSARNAVIAA
jgi:hypothetical protein